MPSKNELVMENHMLQRQLAEAQRKACAFDYIAGLKTEWGGHCCNGKGEFTFMPNVEDADAYDPAQCSSAPTLLEAVELTINAARQKEAK